MSAAILKFPASAIQSAMPDPATVRQIVVPEGESPHAVFMRVMRAWTIDAERDCGAEWCACVLETQAKYMRGRAAFNPMRKG